MSNAEHYTISKEPEPFGGMAADAHRWEFGWGSFALTDEAHDTLSLIPTLLPADADCRVSELTAPGDSAWNPQIHIKLASPTEMSAAVPGIDGIGGEFRLYRGGVTVGIYFYRDMPQITSQEIEAAQSGNPYVNPMIKYLARAASRKAAEGVETWYSETREMHLRRVRRAARAIGFTAAAGLFAGLSLAAKEPANGAVAGSIVGLADLLFVDLLRDTHMGMATRQTLVNQERARSYTGAVQQGIYSIFTDMENPSPQSGIG